MEERDFDLFMFRNWNLIVADFRREYDVSSQELRDMSSRDFHLLLHGLTPEARFYDAWRREPKNIYDPAERAALVAALRR